MRILYWYTRFMTETQRFHGLEKFELNLGTQTRFKYDPKTHHINQNKSTPKLPKGFWGKGIYNINALVGNNGVGKSTIVGIMIDTLNSLYSQTLQENELVPDSETVIVLEANTHRYIIHILKNTQAPVVSSDDPDLIYCRPEYEEFSSVLDSLRHAKIVYITNSFSQNDDIRARNADYSSHVRRRLLFDCSPCSSMRNDEFNDCHSKRTNDYLRTYFTYEVYKQVKFVCSRYALLKELKTEGFPAHLPNTLNITIHGPEFISDNSKRKAFFSFLYNRSDQADLLIYRLCLSCFDSFIGNLISLGYPYNEEQGWEEIVPTSLDIEEWKNAFNKVIPIEAGHDADSLVIVCNEFISFLCKNTESLIKTLIPPDENTVLKGMPLECRIPLTEESLSWLNEFIEYYRPTCSPYYFIDFNWGLSSGENNIFQLFSSLSYLFDINDNEDQRKHNDVIYNAHRNCDEFTVCDSVLLFFDEVDLTLHPEWQRQFVSMITTFLPELYNKECGIRDIQLLMTTHSPLLLGDFPKNCVTYLGGYPDYGEIETFGQNIHQILRDSFFLRNGTIGAFAGSKIDHTAKTLKNIIEHLKSSTSTPDKEDINNQNDQYRTELTACLHLIDLVAPGVLKSKLLEMYRDAKKSLDRADGHITEKSDVTIMSRYELEELARRYLTEHPEG